MARSGRCLSHWYSGLANDKGNEAAQAGVSTTQQGKSGLGIEAQRAAISRFCEAEGYDIEAEHIEVETGKGSDALERRPQLASALARPSGSSAPSWSPSWIGFPATSHSSVG
jgi:hypothetical protein